MVREIEVKALLSEQRYTELLEELHSNFKEINEDVITTVRFRPFDVRVRYSEKVNEIVFKSGDPTAFVREESTIKLVSSDDCFKVIDLMRAIGFKDDPSWIKRKHEFSCNLNGFEYTLCLQHIENFAYLLEVEAAADEGSEEEHVSNIKSLLAQFSCEPIKPEEFSAKIGEYVEINGK